MTAIAQRTEPDSLADVLERVLDKGMVIAGDIRINLLDIELLTIKIRLMVASVDKARQMGIDWWEHDPALSVQEQDLVSENHALRNRIAELAGPRRDATHQEDGLPEDRQPEDRQPEDGRQRAPQRAATQS